MRYHDGPYPPPLRIVVAAHPHPRAVQRRAIARRRHKARHEPNGTPRATLLALAAVGAHVLAQRHPHPAAVEPFRRQAARGAVLGAEATATARRDIHHHPPAIGVIEIERPGEMAMVVRGCSMPRMTRGNRYTRDGRRDMRISL